MTTNRPFFSNFLAAFRAQSAIQKAATSQASATNPYSHSPSASNGTSTHHSSGTTRTLTTKTGQSPTGGTTATIQATGQFQPSRQHAPPPYHRSTSPGAAAFPIPGTTRKDRRGSDSSSEGFREVGGADKWYIGGRTAAGEEKFYKLGMIKKHRSNDRLSLDRLSI
ncbi:hypothetical protein GQ43DRAFT_116498 [Delitschia confertaspora ATCC 74209]|uniref:Uncharacterized protein n=1 Tax=Delitschia confertaspora ATCC 74209 TaxID=1513339 RepID=A0A9P4JHC8_9PLEO|nr:hypothetical protein GQ43DRAFT_116498 [Delitschia confertaspora ATCC 74209]